jgi:hypothetical protein
MKGVTMKNSEILKAAKELISSPQNWMQGDYTNDERTCFCGIGAIAEVLNLWDDPTKAVISKQQLMLEKASVAIDPHHPKGQSFATYNDSHTHEEVLHAFDLAISLAEAEEV